MANCVGGQGAMGHFSPKILDTRLARRILFSGSHMYESKATAAHGQQSPLRQVEMVG